MRPHAVGVAVDVEHDASVQEAVQHGGGHHGVVEDLAPTLPTPRFVVRQMEPFK